MLVVLPLKESGVDSVDVKVRVVGQRDQRLHIVALLDHDTYVQNGGRKVKGGRGKVAAEKEAHRKNSKDM